MTDDMHDPVSQPDERLTELAEHIEAAKRLARDDGVLDDPAEPKWHESGSIHPELDDQTIAPG